MKRFIFTLCALGVFSVAQAAETLPNTVACISQKKLDRYVGLVEKDATDAVDLMLRKADCSVMVDPMEVFVETDLKEYAEVERVDGMRFWVEMKNVVKR